MEVFEGLPEYKIWLIGDSNPDCEIKIKYPLDKKHPVRHNIWTSVLDEIQDYIYRNCCNQGIYPKRLNTNNIYVRNAVENKYHRAYPSSLRWTKIELNQKLNGLSKLIREKKPIIIFTFGQFSYEFVRRANGEKINYPYEHWTKKLLGSEFRNSLSSFDVIGKVNIIPLLHGVISQGDFTGAGEAFIGSKEIKCSYFEYVGSLIGAKLVEFQNELDIWI